jgi:transcriptional regulator with XRE-family HTH domain
MARRTNKPPFAAWLVEQREKAGLKAEEVARRLREAGLQAEDSTYRTWESNANRRPAPDTVAVLEQMFSSTAPSDDVGAGSPDVAAAIDRQTEAIRELVDELRASRDRDGERDEALVRLVQVLASQRPASVEA